MGEGHQRDAHGDQQGEAVGARLGRGVEGLSDRRVRRGGAPAVGAQPRQHRRGGAGPGDHHRPGGGHGPDRPAQGTRQVEQAPLAAQEGHRADLADDPNAGALPVDPGHPGRAGAPARVVSACIAWSAAGWEGSPVEGAADSRPRPVEATGSAIRCSAAGDHPSYVEGGVPLATRDSNEQPTRQQSAGAPSPSRRRRRARGWSAGSRGHRRSARRPPRPPGGYR